MEMNFDLVMDTKEFEVDMKSGLETLDGASETMITIVDTLATGNVKKRHAKGDVCKKEKIRTKLKRNFKGSFGQVFSVEVFGEKGNKELKKLGVPRVVELVEYFICEAMYLDSSKLSPKAYEKLISMGDVSEALIQQLRNSSIKKLHSISKNFECDAKIRYRKSRNNITIINEFNIDTYSGLGAKPLDESISIQAAVTRFNINTGNGRIVLVDENASISFGFKGSYKRQPFILKKKFTDNLSINNGYDNDDWTYLDLEVYPVARPDGKVVKYLFKGIMSE